MFEHMLWFGIGYVVENPKRIEYLNHHFAQKRVLSFKIKAIEKYARIPNINVSV